jgi:Prokaryotic membrane lipoprotein lipid attachment site
MKKPVSFFIPILFIFLLSGCQVIGEIFKAGVWVGVFIVVAVIALIALLISKGSNKG